MACLCSWEFALCPSPHPPRKVAALRKLRDKQLAKQARPARRSFWLCGAVYAAFSMYWGLKEQSRKEDQSPPQHAQTARKAPAACSTHVPARRSTAVTDTSEEQTCSMPVQVLQHPPVGTRSNAFPKTPLGKNHSSRSRSSLDAESVQHGQLSSRGVVLIS